MGFSPYTAHYIITNSLYLYKPFHSFLCLGWLFALQPSFMTLSPYTATHAIGSLRVPLRGVTHSFEQYHISCISSIRAIDTGDC